MEKDAKCSVISSGNVFTPTSDIFLNRNIFVWMTMRRFFIRRIIWIFFCKDKKRDAGESGLWPGHHRGADPFLREA